MFDEVVSIALRYSKEAIGECEVQDQLLSTPPLTLLLIYIIK